MDDMKTIKGLKKHFQTSKRHEFPIQNIGKVTALNLSDAFSKLTPPPLSDFKVKQLIGDWGRNEIHTHISMCSDALQQLKAYELFLIKPQRSNLHSSRENENFEFPLAFPESDPDETNTPSQQELLIECQYIRSLWKNRLNILEMITSAQSVLRKF